MSNIIRHYLGNNLFVPVNDESFELTFQRDPLALWSNDFESTNTIELPPLMYNHVWNHLTTNGIQNAIPYAIDIAGQQYRFLANLMDNTTFAETSASINIMRYRGKDDIRINLQATSFEYLYQNGFIKEYDMIRIPYKIVPANQGQLLLQSGVMSFFLAWQIAESISTLSKLVGEAIDAFTPDIQLSPSVKIGTIIKFTMLIVIETVKLIAFAVAFKKCYDQFVELMFPKLRYFKAMTVDKLLTTSLAQPNLNLTYSSSLKSIFERLTILPVPVMNVNKKFIDIDTAKDDRIVNLGYPTASDTVSTVVELIDELSKMFNLKPIVRGNVLHLEPKGTFNTTYTGVNHIQFNKNLQDEIENEFRFDTSEMWRRKVMTYKMDTMDIMQFDNPKGTKVEYLAYDVNNPNGELVKIAGNSIIDINFATGTIHKPTFFERAVIIITKAVDSFLGTNFYSFAQPHEGVLAVSQQNFSITKILYQIGGRQPKGYENIIGCKALYDKYHTIDEPQNRCFRVHESMGVSMDNEIFFSIFTDEEILLEDGARVDVLECSYNPHNAQGNINYRMQDKQVANNIRTKLIGYE